MLHFENRLRNWASTAEVLGPVSIIGCTDGFCPLVFSWVMGFLMETVPIVYFCWFEVFACFGLPLELWGLADSGSLHAFS